MENAFINDFIEYKVFNKNNTFVFLFNVKKEHPSPFEWTCAVEDFKQTIEEIKKLNSKFVFIIDVRLMGLLSIGQVKEFVGVLESMSDFLEKKLICTSVVAQGVIIKTIFELVKMFYKTKKPLKILNTMDQAYEYIEQCKSL